MTKKLEETFNLPNISEISQNDIKDMQNNNFADGALPYPVFDKEKEALSLADKIDKALPAVKDINTSDEDMDRYADKAEKAFEDLMDLGFNVEDRNAGHIFASAQTMLKNAIEAKNSKSDRKLRAIELQLKKLRLDQNESKNASYEHVIDADHIVSDRNSLINELTKKLIDDK
jgi:hypothetical protein